MPKYYFLGYGFLEAWVFVAYIVGGSAEDAGGAAFHLTPGGIVFALSMLAVGVACVIASARSAQVKRLRDSTAVGTVATVIICAASFASPFLPFWPQLGANILVAVMSALILLMWSDVYARLDTAEAERIAIFSGIAEAVLIMLLLLLPVEAAVAANSLVPALVFGCLVLSRKDLDGRETPAAAELHAAHRKTQYGVRQLVPTIGVPALFVFMFIPLGLTGQDAFSYDSLILLGVVLFVAVLALTLRHIASFNTRSLFAIFSAFVAAVAVALAVGAPGIVTAALIIASWLSIDMLSWLLFARIYRDGFADSVRSFAVGLSILYCFSGIGYLAGLALADAGAVDPGVVAPVCTLVCALLFAITLLKEQSHLPQAAEGTTTDSPTADQPTDNLAAAAEHFGLSQRETQVLQLLMQGRSAPFIRDELYISESTVRTHIRHIHEKLGVPTTQESITLVQNYLENRS